MIFNSSFEILIVILSVLAVSTKDNELISSQRARFFKSDDNLAKVNYNHIKVESKQKPSHKYEFHDFNYKNQSIQESRAGHRKIGNFHSTISQLNTGDLAVIGAVLLGGLTLVSPMIFPELKNMERSLSIEERQGISNFITSRLVGVSESIMGWVEKSVDDLPSFPRLDAQECMKRCICEAHNQPKKYGIIGLTLQLFFPPYTEAEEPLKVVSKYQLAARYGRQDNANCATQYDGCMVNFLDVVQGLINLVF